MTEATISLFMELTMLVLTKGSELVTLFAKVRAENREPTQAELDALDLKDDEAKAKLQAWIDKQP